MYTMGIHMSIIYIHTGDRQMGDMEDDEEGETPGNSAVIGCGGVDTKPRPRSDAHELKGKKETSPAETRAPP
jgi:hypothetical protein